LRLEHEFQTVMDGGALSRRVTLQCLRHRRHRIGGVRAGAAPRGKFWSPYSFGVSARLFVHLHQPSALSAPDRIEKRRPPSFRYRSEAIAADMPDTLTGHNRNIRPSATSS